MLSLNNRTIITVILLAIIGIFNPIVQITVSTNVTNTSISGSVAVPQITVFKSVSEEFVKIGTEIQVTIEINNTGDSSLFSVLIEEPNLPDWSYETKDLVDFYFVEIPAKTQRILSYKLTPKIEGIAVIEPTTVTFYDKTDVDETRELYTAFSNEITIDSKVSISEKSYEEEALILLSALLTVAIVFITINTLGLMKRIKKV